MMTIGLIALDLDGTLLDSQKNLSERNRRALERCARMGIQIVPTTGRAVDGITREVRSLPGVNYAISTNGGTVADLARGISLKRCTLSNAKALEVLGIVKSTGQCMIRILMEGEFRSLRSSNIWKTTA